MGIVDSLKNLFKRNKTKLLEESYAKCDIPDEYKFDESHYENSYVKFGKESYKKSLQVVKGNIKSYEESLERATQEFEQVKEMYPEDSKEYKDSKNRVYRWKQALDEEKIKLKFVRPNSIEDSNYRVYQCVTFPNKLSQVISPKLDLRFHGTPIYFAEQIIKSKSITPTNDRYDGYMKSTNLSGEISVSKVKDFSRTLNCFSDMGSDIHSLPAGAIFAVFPKDKEDAEFGQDYIHSIDFEKNPEQLFGVFSTPENIPKLKEWMSKAGFDPNMVYTFEEFLEVVRKKSIEIDKVPFDEAIRVDKTDQEDQRRKNQEISKQNSHQNSVDVTKIEDQIQE